MKIKDYQKGRNDGLALAMKIVREGGREALEEEMRVRGVTGINVNLTEKELVQALLPIKEMTIRTVLAMSLAVLRDEFGFGKARLQKFMDRFTEKSDCLSGGWVSWADICQTIQAETGIEIDFSGMCDKTGVGE